MSALADPDNWGRAEDTAGPVWAYYGPDSRYPCNDPWTLAQDNSLEEDTLP